MPRLTKEVAETTKPSVFENENYSIEYRKYSEYTQDFRVKDKKSGEKFGLKLNVSEESHGVDGHMTLTFFEGNIPAPEEVYAGNLSSDLRAERPSRGNGNIPPIGGRRKLGEDNLFHFTTDLESFMSVYRGLKNGDFKPIGNKENKSEKVLEFMDKYLFNTEGHREVLREYMAKYPLDMKDDAKKTSRVMFLGGRGSSR